MNVLRRSPLWPFGICVLGIYAGEACLVRMPQFAAKPLLAPAVAFDLLVFVPALFYWLVVRSGRMHWTALAPVMLLSMAGAQAVLPGSPWWSGLRPVSVPLKLVTIAAALRRIRAAWQASRNEQDIQRRCRALSEALAPQAAARILGDELALFWYAAAWRRKPDAPEGSLAFSVHRETGLGSLMGAVLFVSVAEACLMHMLAARWRPWAAWMLTSLSAYSMVWLWGLYQSIRLRPVLVAPDRLTLRVGLRWCVTLRPDQVARISRNPQQPALKLAIASDPQYLVELHEPATVEGLFGRTIQATRLALYVDDPVPFQTAVQRCLKPVQ